MLKGSAFASREAAGIELARLMQRDQFDNPVILALPRGGVPVGLEIAKVLNAPLDLLMVRKIGVPGQPELAAAAIVDSGKQDIVYNDDVMRDLGLDRKHLDEPIRREAAEIIRRRERYSLGRPLVPLSERTVILVDDGVATGTTLRAAIKALRTQKPKEIVVATPVAPPDVLAALRHSVDRIYCLSQPTPFIAISLHYLDFHPLEDDEVIEALAVAPRENDGSGSALRPHQRKN
jgi:putative phosphoribosyl transferase